MFLSFEDPAMKYELIRKVKRYISIASLAVIVAVGVCIFGKVPHNVTAIAIISLCGVAGLGLVGYVINNIKTLKKGKY